MPNTRRTPELRFPGFGGDWEAYTLGDFLEFKNGINAAKDQYGSGTKFINVSDILENDYITYDKIIGEVIVDEEMLRKNEVRYGDLVFQRSSETREEVGTANVYLDKERSAVFGGFVIRGRQTREYVPEFMNYLLKTAAVRSDMTSRSGGSTRYNIGQDSIAQTSITLPSLPEQQKIAAFLRAVDARAARLRRQLAALEAYKRGVMQRIFDREIRFGAGECDEVRLGELAEITTGSSNRQDSNAVEGEYHFFDRSEDIRRSPIYLLDRKSVV